MHVGPGAPIGVGTGRRGESRGLRCYVDNFGILGKDESFVRRRLAAVTGRFG